jgi:hypothetical protein
MYSSLFVPLFESFLHSHTRYDPDVLRDFHSCVSQGMAILLIIITDSEILQNNIEVMPSARVGPQSGLTDQHKGIGGPSAAQSLSNQVPHVASSFPNAPTITVQPRIGVSESQQTIAEKIVPAAPSSHTQELLSAQWDLSRDWQPSHSPLRTARPTQRQSIEGNAEYSLGAPRNNRGKLSRFSQPTPC